MPRTQASDSGEQKLLDDIRAFGWHCLSVSGDAEHEPFSYTVGLFQTYGCPELLIYGLRRDTAHSVLCIAAAAAARGQPLKPDEPTDELLEGYACVVVPVPRGEYQEHFGFAIWYYEGYDFPVQQIVWPSRAGHLPWHAEATDSFRAAQPVLGQHERGA
ncbi:DUF4262 domain-containing protein [Roseateles sp.]|uniref:DUF4262 domain-containing protein n=1 Tax=Roseateles sp. TaxID=1971397 RepID=UPI003D0F497B